ncbi:MAG: anthrax toxin lethal factor-related metalloendopeptidase, partial [Bdellovibrionales bacterium]
GPRPPAFAQNAGDSTSWVLKTQRACGGFLMPQVLLLLCFLFQSLGAQAQVPLLPETSRPLPKLDPDHTHVTPLKKQRLSISPQRDPQRLAQALETQFQNTLRILESPEPTCASPTLPDFLLALLTRGELDRCSALAARCGGPAQAASPRVALFGALCESTRFQFAEARLHFERATAPQWPASPELEEAVYQYASFALYGIFESQVDRILSRIPAWDPAQRKLWAGLIKRAGQADLGDLTKAQIDAFTTEKIAQTQGSFQALLKSLRLGAAANDFNYTLALRLLRDDGPELQNPLLWYDLAYDVLYAGLDREFAKARAIYEVTARYSTPWSKLPVENNTYTYTELSTRVCRAQLLQGPERTQFESLKARLREGQVSLKDARVLVDEWRARHPEKVDVLVTWAGLAALEGQHEPAFQTYFQAHKLCPFFHRANWGLVLEKRRLRYRQMPEFAANERRVVETLRNYPIPADAGRYLVNWTALPHEVRERVAFGSRIFLRYLRNLRDENFRGYIKYAWDLLSESPRLSHLRDVRIGGANYPHDNRLWDDVRGAGGPDLVADLVEVFNAVHGDYNLLGHEMAHQIQFLMERQSPKSFECLVALWEKAKRENNFPDAYSSYNKEEHFAQGVTYSLIPSDSPKRYGLNRSWLERYNPQQLRFIDSLENAKADWSQVRCDGLQ